MKCSNCGKKFTCGCQKAKANNGVVVCKSCVGTYNGSLANKANSQVKQTV